LTLPLNTPGWMPQSGVFLMAHSNPATSKVKLGDKGSKQASAGQWVSLIKAT